MKNMVIFGFTCGFAPSFGRPDRARPEEVQELVQDALTRVYFPKSAAITVVRGGETLYFQSRENQNRFLSLNR